MSAFTEEIQSLAPTAVVELFELDATSKGGDLRRFHCGTNQLGGPVIWRGESYPRLPCQFTGMDTSGQGSLPRPHLVLSNVDGMIGYLIRTLRDLAGATITRHRTLARFLDAANFPDGVNQDADPEAQYPADVFKIDRKVKEDKEVVEFELASDFDMEGHQIPAEQILPICPHIYRRPGQCPYAGPPVAKADDTPTTDPALDACGGRRSSCRLRFGVHAPLPFGGCPGANVLRYL